MDCIIIGRCVNRIGGGIFKSTEWLISWILCRTALGDPRRADTIVKLFNAKRFSDTVVKAFPYIITTAVMAVFPASVVVWVPMCYTR